MGLHKPASMKYQTASTDLLAPWNEAIFATLTAKYPQTQPL